MVRAAQVLVAIAASAAAFTAPRSLPTRTAMKFSAAEAELVPRDVLFGNPEYAAPSVTPDGSKLAYLKPVDGVLNAWVRSAAGGDDRVVTEDTYRGIRQIFWAEDSKTLLTYKTTAATRTFIYLRSMYLRKDQKLEI